MALNANLHSVLLALLASAILSLIDNFVGEIAKEVGLWQFQVTRTLMAIPLLVAGACIFKLRLLPRSFRALTLRSCIVSTGLLLYFAALGFLPVAQAGAGLFSAPIWVLVFSTILFSRKLPLWQIAATLGGFLGVLLVLGVDTNSLSYLTAIPLLAGALYGLGMMATYYWCQDESAVALALGVFLTMGIFSLAALTYFTLIPVSGTEVFALRGYEPITSRVLWLTAFQAAGAVIAVSLISQAYRIGDPALVSVFEYSFLIFAALWTLFLWGRGIDSTSIKGILLILVCGAFIALNNANPGIFKE